MKTLHTKGEWIDKEGQIYPQETGKTLALIPYFDEEDEEQKANARLISAAPDLLDALQTMMIGLMECEIPNDGHSTLTTGFTMDILIAAKNAIKKATL